MKNERKALGFMPLAICALLLSLLLVLITDASRLFSKEESAVAEIHILLENMDETTAEALLAESAFSIGGERMHEAVFIGGIEPQSVRITTRDGRIVFLPSAHRFCARIVLRVHGKKTDDGFLADKGQRLLAGGRLRVDGERITASGLLLSLSFPEADGVGEAKKARPDRLSS